MIYGTYLSAAGMANEQARQDLIANNLANVETTGFKRVLALYQERGPQSGAPDELAKMTGGRWMLPTQLDSSQGGLEETGNPLDLAIVGEDGYLTVEKNGTRHLTRDGQLAVNGNGELSLATDPAARVLDAVTDQPINVGQTPATDLAVDDRGVVRHIPTDQPLAQIKLAVADNIRPIGGNLLAFTGPLRPAADDVEVRSGYVERSNVDPTTELTRLIEAGRLLEANANMIRYQDASLGRLIEASRVG